MDFNTFGSEIDRQVTEEWSNVRKLFYDPGAELSLSRGSCPELHHERIPRNEERAFLALTEQV